jgi:hypothetical protein
MQKVKIGDIKPNPSNPRVIRDEKFKKLCQSIKDFPEMLELRPIVVNDDMIVLGGNMRLRALQELGIKEVAVTLKAQHMCMSMRGVNKPGAYTTTSKMLGVFKDSPEARTEFLRLISV